MEIESTNNVFTNIKPENPAEEFNKRKDKIVKWFKDPYNLTFSLILILGIVLRIYYFNLTKSQPLWWDEADYMAYAKNLAGYSTNWIVTGEHSSTFCYVVALFFKLGLSEAVIKFCLEIIPSILLVFLTYYLIIFAYDNKKLALISSFLMAISWNVLFTSLRFQVDIPAFFLGILSMFVFFQGYEKKQKIFGLINPKWAITITLFLVVLTYSVRRAYFLFGFFFLFYMLCTKPIKEILKDKYNWIGLIFSIAIFFLIEKIFFTQSILSASGTYYHPELPITGIDLQIFGSFFKDLAGFNPLFYLFWIGLALITINIIFSLGYIKKLSKPEVRGDLFFLLCWVITMSYFIFYQRTEGLGDPRWYYPVLLTCFVCISRLALVIPSFVKTYSETNFKQYSKIIFYAFAIISVLLILYGGYYQYQHADYIIKNKIDSFNGIKQAGLVIKDISSPEDIIISIPRPQPAYYSERQVLQPQEIYNKSINNPQGTFEDFLNALSKPENKNVKYIIVSFSEPVSPAWIMKQSYYQDSSGQVKVSKWEIPFMDTVIDFQNNNQDIKQLKDYDSIQFSLLSIKDECFIYKINRK